MQCSANIVGGESAESMEEDSNKHDSIKASYNNYYEEINEQPTFSDDDDFIVYDSLDQTDSEPEILPSSADKIEGQGHSMPQGESDEEEIEWSEDMEEDSSEMEEDVPKDPGTEDLSVQETNNPLESDVPKEQPEKDRSLCYHLDCIATCSKEERFSYLQCIRDMPFQYQAFQETNENPSSFKLSSYSKQKITLPFKGKRKQYFQVKAPVLHTLLNVLAFIPDADTKNKIIAFLMHPGNSKQLAHIFKTVLSSETLWKHVIKNTRHKFLQDISVPRSSAQDLLAFPVVPLKKVKLLERGFVVHQTCPFYHNKTLCGYKVYGLKTKVKNILQKYDIPVQTDNFCGSRKGNFPEELTSQSKVKVPGSISSREHKFPKDMPIPLRIKTSGKRKSR